MFFGYINVGNFIPAPMDPMAIINISEASRGWIPASPQAGSDDLGIRTPMDSEQYSDMKGPEGRSYSNIESEKWKLFLVMFLQVV